MLSPWDVRRSRAAAGTSKSPQRTGMSLLVMSISSRASLRKGINLPQSAAQLAHLQSLGNSSTHNLYSTNGLSPEQSRL